MYSFIHASFYGTGVSENGDFSYDTLRIDEEITLLWVGPDSVSLAGADSIMVKMVDLRYANLWPVKASLATGKFYETDMVHNFYYLSLNDQVYGGCAEPYDFTSSMEVLKDRHQVFSSTMKMEYTDSIHIAFLWDKKNEACNVNRAELEYMSDYGNVLELLVVEVWKEGHFFFSDSIAIQRDNRELADSLLAIHYPAADTIARLYEGLTYGWQSVPLISPEQKERLFCVMRMGLGEHNNMQQIFFSSYHALEWLDSYEGGDASELAEQNSLEDSIAWLLENHYPSQDTVVEVFDEWSTNPNWLYPGINPVYILEDSLEVERIWKSDFTYEFDFLGDTSPVVAEQNLSNHIYTRISTNTLQIHGSSSTQSPQLFDLQGREYGVSWQYEGEYWQGNMMNIVPGLYIVRVGEQSVLVEYKNRL
jgi:hypothetical protein